MGIPATAVASLLLAACGGLSSGDSVNAGDAGICARLCALQEACGIATAACNSECGWFDDAIHGPRQGCYEYTDRMLDCVESEAERLQCSDEGVRLTLSGCPGHELIPFCPIPAARGGFDLIFSDAAPAGACTVEPPRVSVGAGDPSDARLDDGLLAFLNELRHEESILADRSIGCEIVGRADGFAFSLRLRSAETRFEATGFVGSDGTGTASIGYQSDASAPVSSSVEGAPCSVRVPPDPATNGRLAVDEHAIWAEFSCDALTASEECRAEGSFLFEFCD